MICPCEKCWKEDYVIWDHCTEPCPELRAYEQLEEELIRMEGYDEEDDGIFLVYKARFI